MMIILGIKGNEWAWRNKRWDSIDHFKDVQRKWTNWGVGLFITAILLGFIVALLEDL